MQCKVLCQPPQEVPIPWIRQYQTGLPPVAGSGRDKPDPASVTVAFVEDLQIHDSCRRPVGRSAAWWGSIKRKFYDWKSVL